MTAASEPVLRRQDVADGAHICAVGACRPTQREMDTALVGSARVFVDSRTGALAEAGDLVIPMREGAIDASHIAGELGEVFGGRVAGGAAATRSRCSSRWGWRWKTWRPRAWRTSAPSRAAWDEDSSCELSGQRI